MSEYRCSACGSSNLTIGVQKTGGKGFFGLFRQGSKGEEKRVFQCHDCGVTADGPLDEEIKQLIDTGVDSLSDRKNLILKGEKIDWEVLAKKYKNIESGAADRELEEALREEKRREAEKAQREIEQARRKLMQEDSCDDVIDAQEEFGNVVDLDDVKSEIIRVLVADEKAPGMGLLHVEQISSGSRLLSSLPLEVLQEILVDMKSDGILIATRDKYHTYYSYCGGD